MPEHLADRTVVVLDVLRATTTMIAALAAGAREIHVYEDLEETRAAAKAHDGPKILCGERKAQPPPGFDLGNSPGDFTPDRCAGRTLFMTTTNGTPAIVAASSAPRVLIGAVANRSAVARQVLTEGRDATLLCAGQRGDVAVEDVLAAGAIVDALLCTSCALDLHNDASWLSLELYREHARRLGGMFRRCLGARTELMLGLEADIDYCAVPDRFDVIGALNAPRTIVRLLV
jgi:2-phosphosulfolactate phosphatase